MKPDETTYYRPDTAQENLQRRIAILGIVIVAAFAVMLARLWFMQIVAGNEYHKKAEGNRIREISLEAPRGAHPGPQRHGAGQEQERADHLGGPGGAQGAGGGRDREALQAPGHGREGDSLQDREITGPNRGRCSSRATSTRRSSPTSASTSVSSPA